MTDEVLYEAADGIGRVTINREASRNSISWAVMTAMREIVADVRSNPDVRVLVLTGAGEKAFSAGADLTGVAEGAGFTDLHHARGEMARLFVELWQMGKPTIARVRGYALAGGFGLALSCDMVIASDDASSARRRSTWACGRT